MSEKLQRIQDIWNWLPAFRAVAETEHLPTASSMIHVSASSLSRAVGQLEEYFGHELFDRSGRSMELNARGERLLKAVRNSMRRVDDAIQANLEEHHQGPLNWTSSWSLSSLTLEAMTKFTAEYPEIMPKMHTLEAEHLAEDLLQGDLDIAIVSRKIEREGLATAHLGEISHRIYCGRSHSLYGREDVGWDDLEGRQFAAPLKPADGQYMDGWPPDRDREVVMEFARMAVGYRACRDQGLLAVLPELVAREEPGLWELLRVVDNPRHAFAVYREPVGGAGLAPELIGYLSDVFAERTGGAASSEL